MNHTGTGSALGRRPDMPQNVVEEHDFDDDLEESTNGTMGDEAEELKESTDLDGESIRVCVLGLSKSGKSSLLTSFVNSNWRFETEYYPTVEDTYRLNTDYQGRRINLTIVEVGGDESLHLARARQIQLADAFVLVYSTIDRTSFERLHEVIDDIRTIKSRQYFPCVLAANKSEMRNQACVAKEEGHSLGQQLQSPCIPVSAKNDSEGKAVFLSLLAQIFSFGTEEFAGTILEQQDLRSRRNTRRKSSRLRYFQIQGPTLTWKKKCNAKKTLGSIDMQRVQAVEEVDGRTFRIVLQDSLFTIQACNAETKQRWLGKMQELLASAGAMATA